MKKHIANYITGEPNDEYHNPDYEENTCKGNYWLDCDKWYGEIGDHLLRDEHTCEGYECIVWYGYFGEPNPFGHYFDEGVCEYCNMNEEDYWW